MDEIVKQGLRKWPNVPDCFGWLALDARGRWRIGENRALITHSPTVAFIGRNYISDERGRWLFQNGPQRVYVELEYTPWVWRLTTAAPPWSLQDQTGRIVDCVDQAFIDDHGQFVLVAQAAVGVLHDHDSAQLMESLVLQGGAHPGDEILAAAFESYLSGRDAGLALAWSGGAAPVPVAPIQRERVATHFGFEACPVVQPKNS